MVQWYYMVLSNVLRNPYGIGNHTEQIASGTA
jgi:hypothetical protein